MHPDRACVFRWVVVAVQLELLPELVPLDSEDGGVASETDATHLDRVLSVSALPEPEPPLRLHSREWPFPWEGPSSFKEVEHG